MENNREILEEILEVSRENNKMLRSITRSMKISRIITVIYWIFIIGSAIGAYYLIQPYIDALTSTYTGAKDTLTGGLGELINTLNTINN